MKDDCWGGCRVKAGQSPVRVQTERPPDCEIPGQRGGTLSNPVDLP